MITSAKNYTKKKKRKKKGTDRTLGQMVKAKLYRQNHNHTRSIHIHTHKKRKSKKYI